MRKLGKTLRIFVVIVAMILAGIFTVASGHDGCLENFLGAVICPPPMGGIAKTSLGEIVCGKGQCVKTKLGSVQCSKQQGGYVYIDRLGHAVCTGGCEEGSSSMCQTPVK